VLQAFSTFWREKGRGRDFADFALLLIDELSYFLHNSLLNYSGFL
jgi:hypothetical protein